MRWAVYKDFFVRYCLIVLGVSFAHWLTGRDLSVSELSDGIMFALVILVSVDVLEMKRENGK